MNHFLRGFIAIFLIAAPGLAADSQGPSDDLARRQERVASKYAQLEALMLKMAQLEAANNPRQAALLTQAVELSKKSGTKLDLDKIAELLGQSRLKDALDGQVKAGKSLEELLKLLQSEDRNERNKSEQEKIKEQIKEVERMIRLEKSLQGQNEGGGDQKRIAEEQQKVHDRAQEFADKLKEEEEAARPKSEGEQKPGEQKPGQEKPGEQKPGEQKPGEQKPGENPQKPDGQEKPGEEKPGEQKPGEQKPGEQKPAEQKPGEQKPGEQKSGQPMPGDMPPMDGQQSQSQQQQSPKSPVREKIEQAQQRMKAAQQKLEQSQRKESIEEQQKAREELEKAKAELEKILKQLREEEMERTLQALEARFRKMLEMQVKVFEGTKKLDAIPADERTREADVQAGRLGGDEAKIAVEAEKALQLLSEEGSSVAFPATVEQMTDDMRQVAERLNQGKTDTITQGIEEEIVATLEELLQALEQAQEKLEEQKKQDQQQQPMQGSPQEQPLVDAIQELKMIKSLQLRVNRRTDRFAKLLQNENDPVGQANTKELVDALDKLGERQRQVFEIVRDIVTGKNK
jgi:hypothetical protein